MFGFCAFFIVDFVLKYRFCLPILIWTFLIFWMRLALRTVFSFSFSRISSFGRTDCDDLCLKTNKPAFGHRVQD